MAVKFPQGSIIALVDVSPEERITLADFGGSQEEREAKFQQAVSFQRLHKKKLERDADYDPSDPEGLNSGVRVRANELREAVAEAPLITIPETDDDVFLSLHLIIREFDLATDETNAYFREVLQLSRRFLTE